MTVRPCGKCKRWLGNPEVKESIDLLSTILKRDLGFLEVQTGWRLQCTEDLIKVIGLLGGDVEKSKKREE